MERKENIIVNDLADKLKELGRTLQRSNKRSEIYLPPKPDSTQKFLREVLNEKKL